MIHDYVSSSLPLERTVAAEPDDGANRNGDPLFMTSLARGLLVICAFSGLRRRRTAGEISRVTGLSRAAVRRCLYTLCELGYAGCEERRYWLLPKVLGISHGALPHSRSAADDLLEVSPHALGIGNTAGEDLEGAHGLIHRHPAPIERPASRRSGREQQLGVKREVDDIGNP